MIKVKYFSAVLLIALLLLYRLLISAYSLDADNFKSFYKYEGATIENYKTECKEEFENNLSFPDSKIGKAVLCSGFFSFDKELSESSTRELIEILNDSANYAWGEICCFDSGRKIIFYDIAGKPVGITILEKENENLTHSFPYLKKMKWGALKSEPHKKLEKLLSD